MSDVPDKRIPRALPPNPRFLGQPATLGDLLLFGKWLANVLSQSSAWNGSAKANAAELYDVLNVERPENLKDA